MKVVCLDLEGVLIPEIWVAVAEKTGVDGLKKTTRDEPDYDVLMRYRLDLLEKHRISLPDIQEVIGTLDPLPGAIAFTQWLVSQTRLIILSDTFEEFAAPLMKKLDFPTLFCHSLEVNSEGFITNYCLRQSNQKQKAVEALHGLNFTILAAGDSYNDVTMLKSADQGVFFKPPPQITKEYPQFPVTQTHEELREKIEAFLA